MVCRARKSLTALSWLAFQRRSARLWRQCSAVAEEAANMEVFMPLFLIERQFAELVPTDPETEATVKQVNDEIGVQWLFSFLSADKRKTYCLYEAPSAELIRAAAVRLGVPADK